MKKFITENANQTKTLGKLLAGEVSARLAEDGESRRGGEIICLSGDLGAGKTTFTQGFLEGVGAEGPFTSPTFVVLKHYKVNSKSKISNFKQLEIYHIDSYRIKESDVLDLGWKDFAGNKNCITIVEWAEKIRGLVPPEALWIRFKWLDENKREIHVS